MLDWRSILQSFLGFAVPIFYTWLISRVPDFPLAQADLLTLIIWAVGYAIGGWNALKARVASVADRPYKEVVRRLREAA